ncbi:MAG: MXAN_6577-like cysteine-rich protein [Bradymonadaceae bacterium]
MNDRRIWIALAATLFVATGCGDCGDAPAGTGPGTDIAATDGAVADGDADDNADGTARDSMTPVDGDGGGETTGADSMTPVDGRATDGQSGDTDSRCSNGRQYCDGSCVGVRRNAEHCGACGNSCSGKEVCTKGSCICPRYHDRCNGTCVPTHTDPDNCGQCGNACSGEKVCSSASCAVECLPGREACGRTCVDTKTDSDNCGGCGESCADGEGCVDGGCEPAVPVGDAPAKCEGGGPQIGVGAGVGGRKRCLGNVAQNVFRWAACSCDGLLFDNKVRTDAYDSALGRYRPGGLGGSIGTNRSLRANNEIRVRGADWASGSDGARFANTTEIFQQLHVGGDATFRNTTDVRGDGWVEGDVVSGSSVTFHQDLHANQNSSPCRTPASGAGPPNASPLAISSRPTPGRPTTTI